MPAEKKDFFGKTVADVIKQACDALQTPQENLNIEVIETGSTGIFGFIRKNAHIRASIKEDIVVPEKRDERPAIQPSRTVQHTPASISVAKEIFQQEPITRNETSQPEIPTGDEEDGEDFSSAPLSEEPLSQENIDKVQEELAQLLQLMELPSQVTVEAQGSSVLCHVSGDFQEVLIGQEGKTLDSLQYLLRKISARKIPERVRISIDIGEFRVKQQDELEKQARELAALVKEDGKTQIIPSLNPSERRVVHMALQNDKDIRSRSVGEGLFKKVLIYKPGKAKANGNTSGNITDTTTTPPKKHRSSRGRRGRGGKPVPENNEKE
jgi:spoIIIJ-associated protein